MSTGRDGSETQTSRILLIEDNDADARLVEVLLRRSGLAGGYNLTRTRNLEEGLAALGAGEFEVVLLDLGLGDSIGLNTFDAVRAASRCAIIVLSGLSDDEVGLQAVHHGAQDYLLKDELREPTMRRAIRYAIERYRLMADLEEAKEKAEEASKAKSAFLAVMSHEFRTPMNGIIGGLELLKEYPLDEQTREIHQMMRECAVNQVELINDILDLSRIESGKLEVQEEAFHVADLVQSTVGALRFKAESKGLALSFAMDDSLPESIVSDPLRIRQVLVNLIGNAIKFTERGRVHLALERLESGALEFSVTDTGIGIERAKLDMIFEPFAQVDDSYQRRFQGSGLGLAVCRRLAERLGGSVDVTSEPGVGSTFSFVVPFKAAPETSSRERERAGADVERRKLAESCPLNVLIVEDNESSRKVMVGAFQNFGYDVTLARDGLEAIEVADAACFDLILMDLQMPKIDGLEATRRILERASGRCDRPFVSAVTACAMEVDRARCIEAGMDSFLAKPVVRKDLEDLIKKAYVSKKRLV